MEQFEIERKNNRFIYLIKDTNLEFYLLIPNNPKVNMVLNIMENVNNDIVKTIPDYLDKVLVVPVLNNRVIEFLKTPSLSYEQSDNYFSGLINMAYKILMHNNIKVDALIYLNNNPTFNNFNNYFVNKYNSKVSLINLQTTPVSTISNANQPTTPIVGETKEASNEIPKELDNIYNDEIVVKNTENNKSDTNKKEPGFISYVLLGVIIAVVSLVFLYMLL